MRYFPDTITDIATLIDYVRLVFPAEDFAVFIGALERHFDELLCAGPPPGAGGAA